MSWTHIARKDFDDAGRSKMLWALTGLLVLLVAGLSAVPHLTASSGSTPVFDDAVSFVYTPAAFLIPIIGLIIGYQAVVGERESGSIRLLLGLPNSRGDVILGKLFGRSAVIGVASLVAFVVGAIVLVALYDGFSITEYLGLLFITIVMGAVYLSIAIGVSASVSSRGKAILGVVGTYVIFDIAWQFVPMAIYWAIESELPSLYGGSLPAWFVFIERLSPGQALSAISVTVVDFVGTDDVDLAAASRVSGEIPFYLENWFAWIIVAAWVVIPIAIGYVRFERSIIS